MYELEKGFEGFFFSPHFSLSDFFLKKEQEDEI